VDTYILRVEMKRLGWGVEGDEWRWKMRLFVWDEDLVGYCCSLLDKLFFKPLLKIIDFGSLIQLKGTS